MYNNIVSRNTVKFEARSVGSGDSAETPLFCTGLTPLSSQAVAADNANESTRENNAPGPGCMPHRDEEDRATDAGPKGENDSLRQRSRLRALQRREPSLGGRAGASLASATPPLYHYFRPGLNV